MVNSQVKNGRRFFDYIPSVWWSFPSFECKYSIANPFDNYDEKFHEHLWLSKTVMKYWIDEINVQLHKHL